MSGPAAPPTHEQDRIEPSAVAGARHRLVLDALWQPFTGEDQRSVRRAAARLRRQLGSDQSIDGQIVLVGYGGGKDSSYTLAFMRAVQLVVEQDAGATFVLRSVTNRHAAMPRSVMDNIDRCYSALGMYDDPTCELLLVEGSHLRPFAADTPIPTELRQRNRTDLLLTGHRTRGEARPTFCNACNLSMINSFGLAARHGDGIDAIVTGDSPEEQRAYYVWVSRLARVYGGGTKQRQAGFRGFLKSADALAQTYFTEVFGPDHEDLVAERRVIHEVPPELFFFSIFEDTDYASGSHWSLLTELLGFSFDSLAFSFTESDCANPALMAHLRGLRNESVLSGSYADGVEEYVSFALRLMDRKEFPPHLVEIMRDRYRDPGAAASMRAVVDDFVQDAYDLTSEQLVTMLWAPFLNRGERLSEWIGREHPEKLPLAPALTRLLGESNSPTDTPVGTWLAAVSGLTVEALRGLYLSSELLLSADGSHGTVTDAVLAGDPHKESTPDGIISGR